MMIPWSGAYNPNPVALAATGVARPAVIHVMIRAPGQAAGPGVSRAEPGRHHAMIISATAVTRMLTVLGWIEFRAWVRRRQRVAARAMARAAPGEVLVEFSLRMCELRGDLDSAAGSCCGPIQRPASGRPGLESVVSAESL